MGSARPAMIAPLIVTALFGHADFGWLDGMRRTHYPADRNRLPAHLTLFHHLPPSQEADIVNHLTRETRGEPAPRARITGVRLLGQGVALNVESEALSTLRGRLADAFFHVLIPQDSAPWRPHVTIQNKVAAGEAKQLADALGRGFKVRPLFIRGIALWAYRGGPWEKLREFPFVTGKS